MSSHDHFNSIIYDLPTTQCPDSTGTYTVKRQLNKAIPNSLQFYQRCKDDLRLREEAYIQKCPEKKKIKIIASKVVLNFRSVKTIE